MITFKVMTAFPEIFPGSLAHSIVGRAMNKLWSVDTISLKQFADHNMRIDGRTYGGGAGMVISPEVVSEAISAVGHMDVIVSMSANGKRVDQGYINNIATCKSIGIICGRYEGIDARVLKKLSVEEVSIADFVICGGETAAMMFMEAIIRKQKYVIENDEFDKIESYEDSLLEFEQYTHPRVWEDMEVPAILTTGHAENIDKFRHEMSIKRTYRLRPDLMAKYVANNMIVELDQSRCS